MDVVRCARLSSEQIPEQIPSYPANESGVLLTLGAMVHYLGVRTADHVTLGHSGSQRRLNTEHSVPGEVCTQNTVNQGRSVHRTQCTREVCTQNTVNQGGLYTEHSEPGRSVHITQCILVALT